MKLVGNIIIFMALLAGVAAQGADYFEQQRKEQQLVEAAMAGSLDTVRTLVAEKGDPNLIRFKVSSPLAEAANFGHPEIVEFLLSQRADVNQILGQNTPLYKCLSSIHYYHSSWSRCRDGDKNKERYINVVKVLLSHKANLNIKSYAGTILDLGVYVVDDVPEVLELLLEYGAKGIEKYLENPAVQVLYRPKVKKEIADAIPRMGIDPVGVIVSYVI